ncbi:hypothetical protein QFC22_006028 [Naganishia vaughanmartiniae]|uniref:Uncharacterized protein n=1 Tax=Naganishia vaughanmartiniae TaxID=1424756 RepID=A0ACC2WPV2_9TREE|nr:hypothetical protein QFC22_006028 [Naganishia vaughanmartiniae]
MKTNAAEGRLTQNGTSGKKIYVPHHKAEPSRWSVFTKKLSKFHPTSLFKRKRGPNVARSVFVNTPLPTGPEWRDKNGRIVRDKVYPTNQNITSKYTVITFLPRNLFEQFRRIANIFFLGIAILQFFPEFATVSPGLVILPLLVVLGITALKDGYEDVKRHQADHRVNHTITYVLGGGPGAEHSLLPGKKHHTHEVDPVEGYKNYNVMTTKEKTFMPAIPLPKRKGKKAKQALNKVDSEERDAAATTDALSNGIVPNAENEWQGSQPNGKRISEQTASTTHEGPFGDRHNINYSYPMNDAGGFAEEQAPLSTNDNAPKNPRLVNNPDDDLEASDDITQLGWKRTIWEDIKVGDVVKIYENEPLPADIVICATSEEEDVCYVETKNLDGETNLKSRRAVPELAPYRDAKSYANVRFRIDVEPADVNMYRLNGAVVLDGEEHLGPDGQPLVHPVNLETVILRGCVLRNTAWVIGVVLFTGADTKIILNSGETPSKRSKVERQMNPQVLANLALLAAVSVVCAIVDYFNEDRWRNQGAYWELYSDTSGNNPSINALKTFANSFITFQNIVPISLYISIEFVRLAQSLWIYWDHAIKYTKNGKVTRTTARSWNLSDDLGQIKYIFSDKTGTLTQNSMVFRQCSIGGKVYTGDGQVPENILTNDGKPSMEKSEVPSSTSSDTPLSKRPSDAPNGEESSKPKVQLPPEVLAPFHDTGLLADLHETESEQSRRLHGFFAVLGLCHTALAAEVSPGVIEYKAQSPDEAALVQAAADVGFVFLGMDRNIMRLRTPFSSDPEEYELLNVLEFNSTRKRMSVIIRKIDEEGRIFLLCKGADNIIFERLRPGNEEIKKKTDSDLQYFASEGLRTLCLAYKIVEEDDYERWAKAYHDASVALEQREEKIEEVSEAIEQDLNLLGSTAIEDRLQDGVPEAIADLKRAGIKVWVATGDKLETAVAIGYTTNLLTRDTNLIIIREGAKSVYDQLKNALAGFFNEEVLSEEEARVSHDYPVQDEPAKMEQLRRMNTGVTSLVGKDNGFRSGGFSLVIEGAALRQAFTEEATEELLLHLSTQCATVICCRVSPLQKAQIVRLIKDNLGVMTLAIGDGANDVSMIQAADVGVGISGEEGLQAVNSSDYAIAQFRFLNRLLFVHGHWSYLRNSNMILNFFYKNVIGVGVLFWFQIYCGWSTTYVFEYTYLLFWNVFWTLLPVIAMGLFDRDIDAETLMALPELYAIGRQGKLFGLKRFSFYIFEGAYQSAIIFFFIIYAYFTTSARSDGYDVGMYEMSTALIFGAVHVATAFTGLNTEAWTIWVYIGLAVGPILIWIYTAIYSLIPPTTFITGSYGNDYLVFRSALFWFGFPFVFVLALLPRYLWRTMKHSYFPTDIDIMAYIRRYRPQIDVVNDPMLGGRAKDLRSSQAPPSGQAPMGERFEPTDVHPGFGADTSDQAIEMVPRPSFQDNRRDPLGRMQPPSKRGSAVDMSTGLTREQSRGFGFDIEEGGVAIHRMQSRLSQMTSRNRDSYMQPVAEKNSSPFKSRFRSPSVSLGLGSFRQRAGSVLRPKRKGFMEGTAQMEGEEGPGPDEPPQNTYQP